jgi:hypothetical protein
MDLLRAVPDRINWVMLSGNPAAIDILRANSGRIDWRELSENPAAIDLLRENPNRINWEGVSENTSPVAIKLLLENRRKIMSNPNSSTTGLLRENQNQINWWASSSNPLATDILRDNIKGINWRLLSKNPAIFDDIGKAAGKIQQGFRKSRGYAAWKYSPQRLASQGYFDNNMDFGKRRSTKSTKRKSTNNYSLKTIDSLIKLVQKM